MKYTKGTRHFGPSFESKYWRIDVIRLKMIRLNFYYCLKYRSWKMFQAKLLPQIEFFPGGWMIDLIFIQIYHSKKNA
jgi:hypothetical protein